MKPLSFLCSLLVVCFAIVPVTAWAGIDLSQAHPEANQVVTLTLTRADGTPGEGVEVKASYGPGSVLLYEDSVGITNAEGTVAWTPNEAGLVTLAAEIPGSDGPESVSTTVSVTFGGPPVLGVLVMIIAGLILYGGIIRGFRSLSKPPPSFPPDT
jgi:hypothetical protein